MDNETPIVQNRLVRKRAERQARKDRYFLILGVVAVFAILALTVVNVALLYILWRVIDSIIKVTVPSSAGTAPIP